MKQNSSKQFLLALLAAAGSLFACNQVEPEVDPDYNPETKEVATSFVLSVSTSGNPQTKMSADAVQRNNNFYGIDSCKILLFNTPLAYTASTSDDPDAVDYPPFTKWDPSALATQTSEYLKTIQLGLVYSPADITPADNASSSSARILKLNVPVGTSTAVFYGKAASNGQGTSSRGKSWGNIPADGNLSDVEFWAHRRIEDNVAYDATGRLMIYVVNQIIGASAPALTSDYVIYKDNEVYGTYPNLGAISWKSLGDKYADATQRKTLTPLEEVLGAAYYTFTTIRQFKNNNNQIIDEEYRSGSSKAIKQQMISIYAVVTSVLDAKPTNSGEANAYRLAGVIETIMNKYFDGNWNYKELSALRDGDNPVIPNSVWNDATTGFVGATNINNYPGSFNIPEGAAQIVYDSTTGKMSYLDPNRPLLNHFDDNGNNDLTKRFYPQQYYYPVELVYYANSALRTTDKNTISISDFPDGVNPWNAESAWEAKNANWKFPRAVKSTTNGIAMATNVVYGSAMLAATVDYSAAVLNDNKAALTDDEDNTSIAIANAKLNVTGILIGGFNPRVGWQFLRKDATDKTRDDDPDASSTTKWYDSSAFNNVVYDNSMQAQIPATINTPTATNYTLVWDNYNSSMDADHQNDVYVALEIENKGDAFWGKHNLIAKDMRFYLLAKLSPSSATAASANFAWPTDHQIPPIYGGEAEAVPDGKTPGQSKQIRRIFIQDFMTVARFHIGATSLQNAYVSMPDLSQSEMSFGLSVDLDWHTGYEYDINEYL